MHSQFHNRFFRARLIFLATISPFLALWVSSCLASTHLRQCLLSVYVTLKVFCKCRIIAHETNFNNTRLTFYSQSWSLLECVLNFWSALMWDAPLLSSCCDLNFWNHKLNSLLSLAVYVASFVTMKFGSGACFCKFTVTMFGEMGDANRSWWKLVEQLICLLLTCVTQVKGKDRSLRSSDLHTCTMASLTHPGIHRHTFVSHNCIWSWDVEFFSFFSPWVLF